MDDVQPLDIEIPDSDDDLLAQCRVETFRAGGPGGQHQNTTDSAVRLTHIPSGVVVTAREERSQHRNRVRAIERLRAKLNALSHRPKRRVPTKVPRAQKVKRVESKRRVGQKKKLRKPPGTQDE